MLTDRTVRAAAVAAAVLWLAAAVGPVWADSLDDAQSQLQDVQSQMQQQQQRVESAQQQANSITGQLQAIQQELDAADKNYRDTQARLANTQAQIDTNTAQLAKAERDLAARTRVLEQRLRDIYENGQVNYLDVLLGSADFNDLISRLDLLKRVLQRDATLIAQVRQERQLIMDKRAELEQERATLAALQQQALAQKNAVAAKKAEKEQFLNSVLAQRDAAQRAYDELQQTSQQIAAMIRRSQQGGRPGSTGAMLWPVSGPITSSFGWRSHPIFGTALFHSGLDIGVDYGTPVQAADGGTVIYAGWMGGYGKAVIIDHGGGISTLYGHNSELLVSEGQSVRKGQVISYAGSTGYSTGPHVHFEVRVNGSPVDPLGYLP